MLSRCRTCDGETIRESPEFVPSREAGPGSNGALLLAPEFAETAPSVLVVDDIAANRALLEAYLESLDCRVLFAENGEEALRIIAEARPHAVLLDVQMPGMDGFDVCRRIKADEATRLLPVVLVTALSRIDDRVRGLDAGADDFLTKPVERVELLARVRSALRLKAVYDRLDSSERVIFALAAAVEAKDAYTEAHTERVARNSRHLARSLGLPDSACETAYLGGRVHDIGKIGVPDAVLRKPGPLDEAEWRLMRQHPVIGEGIIRPLRTAGGLVPIVRHHHEAWDGSGYPDGLAGEQIPLLARIAAVCDAVDALLSDRPYRPARGTAEAAAVLRAGSGRQWDPDLVELAVGELGASRLGGLR